jgi:hypothetical protein
LTFNAICVILNTENGIGSNDGSDDMGFTGILAVTVLAIINETNCSIRMKVCINTFISV